MKLIKIKNKNVICFEESELRKLFEIARKSEIVEEMAKQNISFEALRKDFSKAKYIVDGALQRTRPDDRDEHEIFAALFIFYDFFEEKSEICFEIKDQFNPEKDKINTLKDLNTFRDGSISDFIIKSKDGIREFQLKRYRGILNIEEVLSFIKGKVLHYGNNLRDMNLLILFQPQPFTTTDLNFQELSNQVKLLNFKFSGNILLAFNKENKEQWMIRLYPDFAATKKSLILPSQRVQALK